MVLGNYIYIYTFKTKTLRIMGSQVTSALEIQKNPAKNISKPTVFLEGSSDS